jgi:hypothetical protein
MRRYVIYKSVNKEALAQWELLRQKQTKNKAEHKLFKDQSGT